MYVTGIGFANVRGFSGERAVHHLPLPTPPDGGSWTVIAGRNGSGKSTFLRALALCLAGPHVARTLVPDFGGWITGGERSAWARAYVRPEPPIDRLTGRGKARDRPVPLGLAWTAPEDAADGPRRYGAPQQPQVSSYDGEDHTRERDIDRIAARGPWTSGIPQGWFCAAYGPFRRLTGGSDEARAADACVRGERTNGLPLPRGRLTVRPRSFTCARRPEGVG